LVSSKAQKSRNAASRLPRTLDPLLDSFAPGSSESQIQQFGMLTGEQSEVFFERLSFYEKNPMFENLRDLSVSSIVCLPHAEWVIRNGVSMSEIPIGGDSSLFVRVCDFREFPNGRDVSDA